MLTLSASTSASTTYRPAPAVVPPTPVAEPERIRSLDVLRGVALLGILVMNIQSFAMPSDAYMNPAAWGDLHGVNYAVWLVCHLLADQKFMSIFSMLFGAGILLVAARAGQRATRIHYRRMAILVGFGLLHAHLLWSGDILYTYGLCGMLVYLARGLPPRRLIVLGLVVQAVSSLLLGGYGFWLRSASPEVVRAVTESVWQSSPADVVKEIAAFRGSWTQQASFRINDALSMETIIFLLDSAWKVGGLMLIGMALFKLGVLSGAASARTYRRMLIAGLGVGLPIIAVGVWFNTRIGWSVQSLFLGSQFNYWGSLGVALAWIGATMLVLRSGHLSSLTRRLAAVGRTAFSNYILQSFIGTTLFYGYGFGLFGHVERWGQLLIVVAIWMVQLTLAPLWLARFRFGPLEWLWRSLTYGARQPWRAMGSDATY